MELRHLKYFIAVATASSFTRAAEALGIGQPPLSQQIKNLEEEIGVRLFQRTSHGVTLTHAGDIFLVHAKQIIAHSEAAIRATQRAERGDTGLMRLGFTGSAAFNPLVSQLIGAFRRAYPNVDMTLDETNSDQLLDAVVNRRLDVAFIRPGLSAVMGVRLAALPDEPMLIVLPSSHPLAAQKKLSIVALSGQALLTVAGPAGTSLHGEVLRACREAGFEPILGQSAPQISSIINLVAAGMGVSVVPAAITQVRVRGVAYIPIQGNGLKARLAIASRRDDLSATVINFLQMAEASLS